MLAGAGLCVTGCQSIGPATVARDRSEYSTSIADSWKRQTLLNIVKLRYLDPPIFVDVGQIVAGYQLQAAASIGGQISSENAIQGNSLSLGGAGTFIDRPTITYIPLTGNRFVRSLMTPLPPDAVFFTIQAGWPADAVLFATVAEINGLKNQQSSIGGVTAPDADFLRVLRLMRQIQLSGAVGMRVQDNAKKEQATILTFSSTNMPAATQKDIRELRHLLKLDPHASEFKLAFGATAQNGREVAVTTRSILQIMSTMASQVDVPAEDVKEGRVPEGWESITNNPNAIRLIHIHCSNSKPQDAFVTIEYRDHWFWIDDRDLKSKRAFSFMMMLFTLADTGGKQNLPLITIPAQ